MSEHKKEVQEDITTLTRQLAGPDLPGESYMEKVGRLNSAKSQATEIVLADLPVPVDEYEWKRRFETWTGGHPISETLSYFHREMTEIDERQLEYTEDEELQRSDEESAKLAVRADLEALGLKEAQIQLLMTPMTGTWPDGDSWRTWLVTPEMAEEISAIVRPEWEKLTETVRLEAWDAPSAGHDYYGATQRLAAGQARF